MIVTAGHRWPTINKWEWERNTHLLDGLPKMNAEHIKIYAERVNIKITDEEARLLEGLGRRNSTLYGDGGSQSKNSERGRIMSERSKGILPEDEQQALGQIIDKIGSEKPDLAEAIRLCAIPHWFNKEILAWLRGEGSKPRRGQRLFWRN